MLVIKLVHAIRLHLDFFPLKATTAEYLYPQMQWGLFPHHIIQNIPACSRGRRRSKAGPAPLDIFWYSAHVQCVRMCV